MYSMFVAFTSLSFETFLSSSAHKLYNFLNKSCNISVESSNMIGSLALEGLWGQIFGHN
jgi:uncharacterized membrane protein YjjB (DUF3815 family)